MILSILRDKIDDRIYNCLNPLDFEQRHYKNIKRIREKIKFRFGNLKDEPSYALVDELLSTQAIKDKIDAYEFNKTAYKVFKKKFPPNDTDIQDEINIIGQYRCNLCPLKLRKNDLLDKHYMTLSHLEESHNFEALSKEDLLTDLVKNKTIYKFILENGEKADYNR